MKVYINTRLHQVVQNNNIIRKSWFNFFYKNKNASIFCWIPKLSLNTSIFISLIIIIFVISYAIYIMVVYIEYKKQDKFKADQYINEIVVPYEAKIEELQNKVNALEAHSLEIIYFEKFIPNKNYIIKGGTRKQKENFKQTH